MLTNRTLTGGRSASTGGWSPTSSPTPNWRPAPNSWPQQMAADVQRIQRRGQDAAARQTIDNGLEEQMELEGRLIAAAGRNGRRPRRRRRVPRQAHRLSSARRSAPRRGTRRSRPPGRTGSRHGCSSSPTAPNRLTNLAVRLGQAGHVLPDQHLCVTVGSRADADGGDRQLAGDLGGQLGGHHLHHHGERTGLLHGDRVVNGLLGCIATALDAEPPRPFTLCGVKPMWAITGMPAAVNMAICRPRAHRPRVSRLRRRVSFMNRVAVARAWAGPFRSCRTAGRPRPARAGRRVTTPRTNGISSSMVTGTVVS